MTSGIKRTTKEIEQLVNNLGYKLIEEYFPPKGKARRVIIQDKIGYKYDVVLNSLLEQDDKPNFVDSGNPYSLENIALWLKLNKAEFILDKNNFYNRSDESLYLYHTVCKEHFELSWDCILQGIGCGVCSGKQIGKYNSLAYKFPEIAAEWHPTKNGKLTPRDVSFSCNAKAWWLCHKGHEYFSKINHRTGMNTGCKQCSDERQESIIATELKEYFIKDYNAKKEYRILKNPENNYWLPYDIYIPYGENPELKGYYVEIHGIQHYIFTSFWHKTKDKFEESKKRDKLKKNFAKKNGVYIEVDLRKIKTIEEAIEYIEKILR